MDLDKVFVFGTLKEGFPNYHINNGTRLKGEFQTLNRYPLYLVGERNSPWLVLEEGEGWHVKGEVYSVTREALTNMDKLERILEPDGYQKETIQVRCCETEELIDVLVYGKTIKQIKNAKIRKILAGEYLIEHSILYQKRRL
ncbi:gamma-glutamylcyclotransferase family protein [Thaumasiovibrio sp. DFM-14]|uniref:gamma-glutamylcyclotransferase family protein n=1 Tax=Thaumasiovibrio sp. DFM-14 TaxID=3384792 RepID=UPI0039A15BDA